MSLKTKFFWVAWVALSFSWSFTQNIPAQAGGPSCAPGYCLDEDGNGCHSCGLQASIALLPPGCDPCICGEGGGLPPPPECRPK